MLSAQEFKIYMLIVERAWSSERIAAHLGTRNQTVRSQTRSICDKLGCGTRLEMLSQYHYREGNL